MADHDQLLRPLAGDLQELGANRFGVPANRLVRAGIDEVDRPPRYALGAKLLGVLCEVARHPLVKEARDEDVTIPPRGPADFGRDREPAPKRRVEPRSELGGRDDRRGGCGLGRAARADTRRNVKNPSTASSFLVRQESTVADRATVVRDLLPNSTVPQFQGRRNGHLMPRTAEWLPTGWFVRMKDSLRSGFCPRD